MASFCVTTVLKMMCCELRTLVLLFHQPTSTRIFWSFLTIWAPISFKS